MAKTHALSRGRRGNGSYEPTLGDVHHQLQTHEAADKAMHEETSSAIKEMSSSVKELTKSVTDLLTDRAVREAVEKKTRNLYVSLITVAGIVIPIAVAVWDHMSKVAK